MSLDAYVDQTLSQLKDVIADFVQDEASATTVDGQPAKKVLFHGVYLGQQFSWEQIYTVKNGTIYVMTYLAPTETFSGQRDTIEAAFDTFTIN